MVSQIIASLSSFLSWFCLFWKVLVWYPLLYIFSHFFNNIFYELVAKDGGFLKVPT